MKFGLKNSVEYWAIKLFEKSLGNVCRREATTLGNPCLSAVIRQTSSQLHCLGAIISVCADGDLLSQWPVLWSPMPEARLSTRDAMGGSFHVWDMPHDALNTLGNNKDMPLQLHQSSGSYTSLALQIIPGTSSGSRRGTRLEQSLAATVSARVLSIRHAHLSRLRS